MEVAGFWTYFEDRDHRIFNEFMQGVQKEVQVPLVIQVLLWFCGRRGDSEIACILSSRLLATNNQFNSDSV